MKYIVRANDGWFQVIEKESLLVIASSRTLQDMRELAFELNMGSGFDGRTPPFMTKSVSSYLEVV